MQRQRAARVTFLTERDRPKTISGCDIQPRLQLKRIEHPPQHITLNNHCAWDLAMRRALCSRADID
jgi:hypothetical protein